MKKLLYFSAEWCSPCKMVGPVMEELKAEGYNVQKIDVDSNQELSQQFAVRNIPTVILTVDGVDSGRKVGANPKAMYLELYNQD
jgi:thioredoxin 1